MLTLRGRVAFEDLFENMSTKFDLVITFLALLEMTRLRMTRLFQAEPLGPLHIELAAGDPEAHGVASASEPPSAPMTDGREGEEPSK